MEKPNDIITLHHVDAGYPGAIILEDVTFEVKRGEIFILLGGSGCGKSTIMKHMIGAGPSFITPSCSPFGPITSRSLSA